MPHELSSTVVHYQNQKYDCFTSMFVTAVNCKHYIASKHGWSVLAPGDLSMNLGGYISPAPSLRFLLKPGHVLLLFQLRIVAF